MPTTKAEQETTIRWDQEERMLHLYTAYPVEAKKWAGLGYVVEVSDRAQTGEPRGWTARAPLEALRLRKLEHGHVVSRRRGRGFAVGARKLAAPERPAHREKPRGPERPRPVSDATNQRGQQQPTRHLDAG